LSCEPHGPPAVENVVARVRAPGAQLVGELIQYEDAYKLCYLHGPEGILIALAEKFPKAETE
jgi:hypothetical protein